MAVFVGFLCIFTIAAWILFLRNFKKLFSTDDVIRSTKTELNKLIVDLNSNAERNITLLDSRIGSLKALIAEADRKIKLMDSLEAKGAALSAFKTTVAGSAPKRSGAAAGRAAAAYGATARRIRPDDAVSLVKGGAGAERQDAQNMLFDERDAPAGARTEVVMTESGASYAAIPVVAPKVYASETPVVPRTDLKSEILSLFDAGLSVDDVAARLSCSLTEVQLTLSLANRI